MGVVIRQGFWSSVISYFGVGLGYLATLVIFPKYLDVDQIGLIRLIQANGLILVPLITVGLPSYWVLNFPLIKSTPESISKHFSLLTFLVLIANALFFFLYQIFQDQINSIFESESSEYIKYIFISLIILLSQSLFEVFTAFFRTNLNVTIPGYFKEVHLRLFNLVIILAHGFGTIHFANAIYLMGGNYLISTLLLLLYLQFKYKFNFTLRVRDAFDLSRLVKYGGYFTILTVGVSIMSNVGSLLTSTYLGLEANGVFTTCLYIGVIIEMPRRAASQILTPLISEAFEKNDHQKLKDICFRASINLSVISAILFIGIITNVGDLFDVIPKGEIFREGFLVVLLVGASKVIGMSFGAVGEFLTYSPYKRKNLYVMVLSSIVMILATITLIPTFGIAGAAWGMLISMTFNQLLNFYWLYTKLDLIPFRVNHLKLLLITAIAFLITIMIPFDLNPYLNILIRSLITSLIFFGAVYWAGISEDLNASIKALLRLFWKG